MFQGVFEMKISNVHSGYIRKSQIMSTNLCFFFVCTALPSNFIHICHHKNTIEIYTTTTLTISDGKEKKAKHSKEDSSHTTTFIQ